MNRRYTSTALLASGALLTVALLLAPTRAFASQPSVTPVYYTANDLATDRGIRALYSRIAEAAKMVCPEADPRKLWQLSQSKACQRQAIARAVTKIANPRLTALYAHMPVSHG